MPCQAGEKVLSLEWLRDRSAEEARAYLMSIDGEPHVIITEISQAHFHFTALDCYAVEATCHQVLV